MGEVYRAHDEQLGRDVAIKTLPPQFARDPEGLVRLRHEARLRMLKPGFHTVLGTGQVMGGTTPSFDLDPEGSIPAEMVRVPSTTGSGRRVRATSRRIQR